MQIESPSIQTLLDVSGSVTLTEQGKSSLVNILTSSLNTIYTASGSSVSYSSLSGIPSGIVSGSTQLNNSTLTGMTITGSFNGNGNDLNITGSARTFISPQRGFVTTDNDGTFDMNVGNNFKCQPTGSTTLNFSNTTSGQSGFIILINTGSFTISANSSVKVASDTLTTVSVSGSYVLSYVTDGTNVYVVDSGALS